MQSKRRLHTEFLTKNPVLLEHVYIVPYAAQFFWVKHFFFANEKLTEKANYEGLVFEIVREKIEQEQ